MTQKKQKAPFGKQVGLTILLCACFAFFAYMLVSDLFTKASPKRDTTAMQQEDAGIGSRQDVNTSTNPRRTTNATNRSNNTAPVRNVLDSQTYEDSELTTGVRDGRNDRSRDRTTSRTRNAAQAAEPQTLPWEADGFTSAAEYRAAYGSISTPTGKISQSAAFKQLAARLRRGFSGEDAQAFTALLKNYIEKEREQGRDVTDEFLEMMGEETDPYLRSLYAQALGQAATDGEVAALLSRWLVAQTAKVHAQMEHIGAIIGFVTQSQQTRTIGEFVAQHPESLEYFGTAPGQNGTALGVNAVLYAFAHTQSGSQQASELAEWLEKIHGTQAVASLDAVLNNPRDESQRALAANTLAAIGSNAAIETLTETLGGAVDPDEVSAISSAIGSIANPTAINALADRLLDMHVSSSVTGACTAALGNFTQAQLEDALGARYETVAPMLHPNSGEADSAGS